jgi:predicted patatin/cPLA2 family phospholipase
MEERKAKEELAREIEALKEELKDREKALPAHTIRPHQLLAIEELEEKISRLEEKFRNLFS